VAAVPVPAVPRGSVVTEDQGRAAKSGQPLNPFLFRLPSADAMAKLRGYLASEAHRSRQDRIMTDLLAAYPSERRSPAEAPDGADAAGDADGGAAPS
jgi:hypothetical protein